MDAGTGILRRQQVDFLVHRQAQLRMFCPRGPLTFTDREQMRAQEQKCQAYGRRKERARQTDSVVIIGKNSVPFFYLPSTVPHRKHPSRQ